MYNKVILTLVFYLTIGNLPAQQCTTPGQTPVSAIFVCGTASFSQGTPQFCGQSAIPINCAAGFPYQNTNPNFFRFACYSTGTLGFTIVPNQITANYDWQLFDVTSTNPVDIFTNPNLFVAANWSSEPGETGATDDGTQVLVCGGPGLNVYSKMPTIVAGRSYILMVSNQSGSTSGYVLTFTGGSASITDAVDPHLRDASVNCDRTQIYLQLNKQVICNSVALNGSDFSVSGGVIVISALPTDCSSVFGSDRITLTLDQPLPLGNHTLRMNTGTDGNTLVDMCNRDIPVAETINLISAPPAPTLMDSIISAKCSPAYVELVFRKPIRCSSIASDGSDFLITGPQTIVPGITLPACATGNVTNIIRLDLPAGYLPGTYQVRLRTGIDGNTILDECGSETAAGSTVSFSTANAVSAIFTHDNNITCTQNSIHFSHDGANGVTAWNWDFGNGKTSSNRDTTISFLPGNYTVKLTVTNGTCSDTWTKTFSFSSVIKASFKIPGILCPGDSLPIENISQGNIDEWKWNFGNGNTSNVKDPPAPRFLATGSEISYTIQLIAVNSLSGCGDTISKQVKVLPNCLISVPSAFTPNNDGKNDLLYPINAVKAANLEFRIYNRSGQLVFFTKDWTKKWDGKIGGLVQDTGIYAWLLSYTLPGTGEKVLLKGTVLLLR